MVYALFEDREGTIWVATSDGLDRFRELPVTSLSVQEGLSSAIATSVLAARDGSIWIGTADGLNQMEPRTHDDLSEAKRSWPARRRHRIALRG